MSPARSMRSPIVALIALVVGFGFLGGGAAAYYYIVQRPLTWPMTDAVVVSSRVVNPRGPSDHQPEIVFLLSSDMREVRTIAAWSSGSYDMVRAYVDRFPAGTALRVVVNPDNASDVRYELGPTFTNMIVPGVLGLMGAIFGGVGLVGLLWRPRAGPDAGRGALRWVSTLFIVIGLIIGGIAGWLLSLDTPLSWPTVEAEVVASQIIQGQSASSRGRSAPTYDIQVSFAYTANGKAFTSQTASGSSSSSRSNAEGRLATYAPGSKHDIRYRPDDPNVIRFEVTPFGVYILPGALLGMGIIFGGMGMLTRRMLKQGRRD